MVMARRWSFLLFVLVLAGQPVRAHSAPRRIPLSPPATEVAFRAYGLGLVPLDASFARFDGWLSYDPDNPALCSVSLLVDVASLVADDPSLRATVVGPDFMDAAKFPTLSYAGSCDAGHLGGVLGMHGVTRPFALSLEWERQGVVAEGRLLRADWGMTAMPFVAGRSVRIRVSVSLSGH